MITIIKGEPPAGLTDPLIDGEGFPRGDIDLYNVKNKRARLRAINNGTLLSRAGPIILLTVCRGRLQSSNEAD